MLFDEKNDVMMLRSLVLIYVVNAVSYYKLINIF